MIKVKCIGLGLGLVLDNYFCKSHFYIWEFLTHASETQLRKGICWSLEGSMLKLSEPFIFTKESKFNLNKLIKKVLPNCEEGIKFQNKCKERSIFLPNNPKVKRTIENIICYCEWLLTWTVLVNKELLTRYGPHQ